MYVLLAVIAFIAFVPIEAFGLGAIFLVCVVALFVLTKLFTTIIAVGPVAWYLNWFHSFPFGCIAATLLLALTIYLIAFVIVVTRGKA